MKILYTSNLDIRKEGSDKTHFVEVAQNLVQLGHQVLVLVPGYQPRQNRDYRLDIRFIPTFSRSAPAYLWAELLRVPLFIHAILTFRPDAIYARQGLFDLFLPLAAQLWHIPYISEVNGIAEDEFRLRGASEVLSRFLGIVTAASLRLSSKVVCVTVGLVREIGRRYSVPDSKLVVISNGANTDLFSPMAKADCRTRLGLGQEFIVGFVGSFAPWHGLNLLLESAKRVMSLGYSEIRYLLVGAGEQESQLRKQADEDGLRQQIIFTGRVAYTDIKLYVNAMDVALYSSPKIEMNIIGRSPLKLYEYLACGRPVIAADLEGVRELIVSTGSGYLYQAGDAEDLAQKIIQAYRERDALDAMGKCARMLVLEKYSWRATARQVAAVLEQEFQVNELRHGSVPR